MGEGHVTKTAAMNHPEKVNVPQVRFICEQDGPPERELKTRLNDFFRRDRSVKMAYLARVAYGDSSRLGVALCVRTQFGTDPGMAEKVGRIFASMFGRDQHLDIIFVTPEQEASLTKLCRPFFTAEPPGPINSG